MSRLVYSLRNQVEEIRAEIWWTGILTVFFVLASYLILRYTAIPQPRFDTEKFAEIDFTKFIAPDAPRPKPRQIPKEKTASEPEPLPSAPQQSSEPELNIFETLSDPLIITPPTAPAHERWTPDHITFTADKLDFTQRPIDMVGAVAGQNVLQSKASTPLRTRPALPNSAQLPEVRVSTGNLTTEKQPMIQHRGNGLKSAGLPSSPLQQKMPIAPMRQHHGAAGASGRTVATEPPAQIGKQAVENNVQKIEVKNFTNVDLKRIFKVLFIKLAEWLEQNHKELSPAVKHFMNYKTGDLTTAVMIETDEQLYELFIRCDKSSEEVGILMAAAGENGEAIYLRDVGFKQQSHYLGLGLVGRNKNAEVFTVSMREETPTREQTARFYNIFLSWWKTNNP